MKHSKQIQTQSFSSNLSYILGFSALVKERCFTDIPLWTYILHQFRLITAYGKKQEDQGFVLALQLLGIKMYALGFFSGRHHPLEKTIVGISAKHFHHFLEDTSVQENYNL